MHHLNVFRRNCAKKEISVETYTGTVYKLSEIIYHSALKGCHHQNFSLRAEEEGEKVVRIIVVDDSKKISFFRYNRTAENSNL